jgi:hypothetical protein
MSYTGDWHDQKLVEQKEVLSAEVKALRQTVSEQHQTLARIRNILVHELQNSNGKFHHVLTHFEEQLTEMLALVQSHMGKS